MQKERGGISPVVPLGISDRDYPPLVAYFFDRKKKMTKDELILSKIVMKESPYRNPSFFFLDKIENCILENIGRIDIDQENKSIEITMKKISISIKDKQ